MTNSLKCKSFYMESTEEIYFCQKEQGHTGKHQEIRDVEWD